MNKMTTWKGAGCRLLAGAVFVCFTLAGHASGVTYPIDVGIPEGSGTAAGIHAITLDGQGNILGSNIQYKGTTPRESLFSFSSSGGYTTTFQFDRVSSASGPKSGTNTDGSGVNSLVLGTDGALYGAASAGGAYADGTLFKFTPAGQFTVLHSFNKLKDGSQPTCLVAGSDGSFYGTTAAGGSGHSGTVFKLAADGSLTTLHAFAYVKNDSASPPPSPGCPTLGSDGNLYGVLYLPPQASPLAPDNLLSISNLYKVTPAGTYSVLSSFVLQFIVNDGVGISGVVPAPRLALGGDGALYGVLSIDAGQGGSQLFRLNADGSITKNLASVPALPEGPAGDDAQMPLALLTDLHGNFYGAIGNSVFSASADGASVPSLYDFANSAWKGSDAASLFFDGYAPTAWAIDGSGNLIVASLALNDTASIVRIVPGGDLNVSMTDGGEVTFHQGQNINLSWSTTGASQCAFVGTLPNNSGILAGNPPPSGQMLVPVTYGSVLLGSNKSIAFALQCSDSQGGIGRSSLNLVISPS